MKNFIVFIVGIIILASCHTKNDNSHQHEDNQHNHGDDEMSDIESLSYTLFSDSLELFVEFHPLIEGEATRFIAHFTRLSNYKPITEGSLTITLKGEKQVSVTSNEPDRPGIFTPYLVPEMEGIYNILFEIETNDTIVSFSIDSVWVFYDEHEMFHFYEDEEHQDHGDITFLKEQAWNIDFGVQEVKKSVFHEVIQTTGEIIPAQGDEFIVTAKHSGNVLFRKAHVLAGKDVKAGESLFNISSSELLGDNVKEEYLKAKANFEKSKSDFERAGKLVESQLISQKEYLDIKLDFEIKSNAFNTIKKNYSKGGAVTHSPADGFIKYIYVSEGEFVEVGQPLASISKNRKQVIKADLAQEHFLKLTTIFSANFKTPYDNIVYDIKDLNGELISYGRHADISGFYTPVYFNIDNIGNFIPGSYIEIFLKSSLVSNAIVIPRSALLEEIGHYYVFVQTGGESFEKRDVTVGHDDGMFVMINSGLNERERVVSKGAYRVKLASLSKALPSHGHAH